MKRTISHLCILLLTVGMLAACNNNKDNANNQINDTNNDRDFGTFNTSNPNGKNNYHQTDTNGVGTLDTRNNNRFGALTTGNDNNVFKTNRDQKDKNKTNGTISSYDTDIPSSKYPHTTAVQVQPAKYSFYPSNNVGTYEQWLQFGGQQWFYGAAPGQQPNAPQQASPAPGQQPNAPQQAAPAPGQQQNAPQQSAPAPGQQQNASQQPAQQQPAQQQPAQQQKPATPAKEQPKAPAQDQKAQPATSISQAAQRVIELTNAERRKNGLKDLQADAALSKVAQEKANDMQNNNYFSHTSPTYGSPFDMMRDFGVSYKTAGENIAQGQTTPEEVVKAWMNSEGHRKNIMSNDFTHIGVGYNSGGQTWSQMFIGK